MRFPAESANLFARAFDKPHAARGLVCEILGMSESEGLPRLSEAEQEVLLAATEGEDLFHIVWGLRGVVHGEATDEELRPQADALIRKLIGLGWVRLARAWQDKLPPGQHNTVTILGRSEELDRVYHEEPIPTEQFDAVLLDPRSWGLDPPEVVLVTTDEGDRAIADGVLSGGVRQIPQEERGVSQAIVVGSWPRKVSPRPRPSSELRTCDELIRDHSEG